ncbi:MAG: ribosome biogenesis GTP-binding protein YsxC [Chitinophagia bacterium]|nr:ribosome biogenesis GTP-binding protein YsxC [Chitinophagia bacterium]
MSGGNPSGITSGPSGTYFITSTGPAIENIRVTGPVSSIIPVDVPSPIFNVTGAVTESVSSTEYVEPVLTPIAKTSATPGKTQLINHFSISSSRLPQSKKNHWYLVDLPGYGYAKIAQTERARWEKMIAHYLTRRTNLTEVFVLIDSRHSPQKIDLAFVHQLGKWGVPFSLVFTKSDKEKPGAVTRHVQEFLEALKKTWQFLPRHFVTSVETKAGRDEIIRHIEGSNELLLNPESVR